MTVIPNPKLAHVHPDLVRVFNLALLSHPMMVVGGARSQQEAFVNFGKGRTPAQCLAGGCPTTFSQPKLAKVTWVGHALSSKHIIQADGYAHAIDLSPVPYEPKVTPEYTVMSKVMKAAAAQLGVKIRWGGDFVKDFPHYELV